jgi:hypothetical protein
VVVGDPHDQAALAVHQSRRAVLHFPFPVLEKVDLLMFNV